jgi:4-amino-4-deoxy-L-arabinose transferase-like glycosyltransferase
MRQIKKQQDLVWLLITLYTLLIGQGILSRASQEPGGDSLPWLALIVIGIGAAALWIGRSHQPSETIEEEMIKGKPITLNSRFSFTFVGMTKTDQKLRAAALLLAVALIVLLLWRIPHLNPLENYTIFFLIWILATLLFLTAVARPAESYHFRVWLRQRGGLLLAVGSIVLLSFLLRVWSVGTLPFTLGGDEASQGLEALRVINGEIRNPFTTGWLGVPTMSFFYNSLSIRFLGSTIFALRLPWVIVGTITVLTTFLLVRQLLGTRMALVTVIILATYHYHIHYSRLGSNQVADPLFLSLALYFLYRALDRRSNLDWALMGTVSGLAFYVYAGARLTPVVIVTVLAYIFLLNPRRFWRENHQGILVGVAAFLIVAAPMLQYAARFPDDFNARINQVGIIQSGWLAQEVEILEEPTWKILLDQFQRASLAFHYYSDRTVWYGLREPLLDPLFGGLFLLGLFYGIMQMFDRKVGPRIAPMMAWWWGGILLGGMLTESPPSSQRLITLAVPVSFFIAYAMWELVRLVRQALRWRLTDPLLVIFTLMFIFISLTTYFNVYTPQRIYGGQNAEMATGIAPILNGWKQDHRFYFVGAPSMFWGFATLPYLVPDADARDILQPMTNPISSNLLPQNKGAVFIVLPQRMTELDLLMEAFQGGELLELFSPVDGRHMVTLYKVSP